jgi:ubiquinone/menaquinone biosynthesis C-methylase UbiE
LSGCKPAIKFALDLRTFRDAMPNDTDAIHLEYDRLATSYDRRWRTYVDVTLHTVMEGVGFQGHERVLDIACGTGELERLLLARWPGLRVTGTDLSLQMLRRAWAKKDNHSAAWVQAEATHLPFPDHAFDCAVCANSFHYFRSPGKALQEAHRVLRPHGLFVLLDWCDDYLSCKLCGLWLRLTDAAFCGTYTVRACHSLLEEAGFEVVRSDQFRVRWIWGMMRFVCCCTADVA